MPGNPLAGLLGWVAHAASFVTCALVLIAAGQPIFTDDLWLHLALGKAYAANGIALSTDPHLFTATAAPAPAAWLADLLLYSALESVGFAGLRILHVASVIAILSLAWVGLRRAADNAVFASAAVAVFASVSAYRLIQLRPELASIALLFLVYLLVLDPASKLRPWKIAFAALVGAIWVNLHAAFLLGPLLLLGVAGALFSASLLCVAPQWRAQLRSRGAFLALAGASALLGTLCNPRGLGAHAVFWIAGRDTPSLSIAVDEWRSLNLLAWPIPNLPPSWLTWIAVWACSIFVLVAGVRLLSELRRPEPDPSCVDPSLFALATAGLLASFGSVRFVWLSFFSLLLVGACLHRWTGWRGSYRSAIAALSIGWIAAFWSFGDWPMVSRAIHPSLSSYARSYPAEKNNGHAVWMLRDAGLEGNVYNRYSMGGFLSFWLAPRLKMSASGSMNMERERFDEQLALRGRKGLHEGERFTELLDRAGIDLFLGSGLPVIPEVGRPRVNTTTHLADTPGWILVFRNLDSGVYLRDNERNRSNLERVAAYYQARRVPFDPAVGFDVRRVIREAPRWSLEQGIIPTDFRRLLEAERSIAAGAVPDRVTGPEIERLAKIYAALGLYEQMLATNRLIRSAAPTYQPAIRREIFGLLRLERYAQAARLGSDLAPSSPPESHLAYLATSAIDAPSLSEDERKTATTMLPILTARESRALTKGYIRPVAREP